MEEHKDFPKFWTAVLILALLVCLQIIIAAFAYDLGFSYELGDPKSSVITVLSCGIALSLLMGYKKIGYQALFNPTSNSLKSLVVVLIVPITFTVGGGVFWITDITNLMLVYFPASQEEYLLLARMLSGGVATIVSVCLIAPFIEEMLFRGLILRSFLQNYSSISAIALSSLLFALFHFTVSQLPVAFILGCFLGWLYLRTKSLWPSILAHFLYNSLVIILQSLEHSSIESVEFTPGFHSFGVILLALASSTAGLLALYFILRPRSV